MDLSLSRIALLIPSAHVSSLSRSLDDFVSHWYLHVCTPTHCTSVPTRWAHVIHVHTPCAHHFRGYRLWVYRDEGQTLIIEAAGALLRPEAAVAGIRDDIAARHEEDRAACEESSECRRAMSCPS